MATIGALDWAHVFIDVPGSVAETTRSFWSRVLCWPTSSTWDDHPEFTSFDPPDGDAYVHVQEAGAEPRVHLDVIVDDLDTAEGQAARLGAERGSRIDSWQVMRSPGGLPLCLCRNPAAARKPAATRHPDGHRSRLVQVCVDIPADLFDRELAFWERLTGWDVHQGGRSEFIDLVGPPRAPLRLLLQRLDPDDTGTSTRAHIDLGADDRDAEVERLVGLGARHVRRYAGWTVLEDAAGLPFCVTDKPPD